MFSLRKEPTVPLTVANPDRTSSANDCQNKPRANGSQEIPNGAPLIFENRLFSN